MRKRIYALLGITALGVAAALLGKRAMTPKGRHRFDGGEGH